MTHSTRQVLVAITVTVFSLGVMGWLMWKFGVLEILLSFVVNFAFFWLMFAGILLGLNPATWNMFATACDETIEMINQAASKLKPGEKINLEGAIPNV